MTADLFREEVLLSQRGERLGSIRLQAPRLGIGLLPVAAILALLLGGHYTRHEQVAGTLVLRSALFTITPIAAGIVTRVRGQLLACLPPKFVVSAYLLLRQR
ncbi:MAG: hypothetical protein ACREPQ_13790 [Rhodanobacter sp.]